jgi:hypothetical protein
LYKTIWGVNQAEQTAKVATTVVTMSIEHGMPDMLSLYAYADVAYGVGAYHEIAANWMLNGPDSRFSPYGTLTSGATFGYGTTGFGIGLRAGWNFDQEPTIKSFLGLGTNIDVGGSVPGRPLINFGLDMGTSYDGMGLHWATVSGELGVGLPSPSTTIH